MPWHPICVHSRVIALAINYEARLGSLFLNKWTNGFRTSIWVELIHISSFPGHLLHRLWSPRTNLSVLPSFSTDCSSLLVLKSRWRPSGLLSQGASKRVRRKRHAFGGRQTRSQIQTPIGLMSHFASQTFSFLISFIVKWKSMPLLKGDEIIR